MTAIYTNSRIAGLIAAGKVRKHLAPTRVDGQRSDWAPGHSHPVRVPGKPAVCRVLVSGIQLIDLHDLAARDLHDTGHRTTLALARWWLRGPIARRAATGSPWTDDEVLARFERQHDAVAVTFVLDTMHQPRLLHQDPAQGYTHLPQLAATGEGEAVDAWDIERQAPAARERHRALIGLLEQQELEQQASLEARLQRLVQRARATGMDIRDELRVIEQRIHRVEQRVARRAA